MRLLIKHFEDHSECRNQLVHQNQLEIFDHKNYPHVQPSTALDLISKEPPNENETVDAVSEYSNGKCKVNKMTYTTWRTEHFEC